MNIVAIDIGGTEIKYGSVTGGGEVKFSSSLATEASKGVEQLLDKIYSIVEKLKDEKTLGIAVSATGQIDGLAGKVVGGTNLIPGWIGTDLVKILEEKYSLPAVLENDVNCAALGEMWMGAAKNRKNFLCLTIGTGIGGGIVLDGKLLRGESSVAAEFGHIQIVKNGEKCGCGSTGCYQSYASTTALLKLAERKLGKKLNGKEIFDEVHKNNLEYKKVLDEWADYFTDGLATLIYIFNPSLIVIGGGVSKQGSFLKNIFQKSLETKVMKNYLDILEMKMAERGNDAGMLGASYLLLEKMKKS
ncbi:ROK family protein [Candidatus Cetobacterium colombiensis]|uniref:ROK family protein n=1 Tax=Candidatus Cetobacterium colombiensis TaxID=3073100 RepID=A0ABU4WDC5_9FUSO|nr:ROK family protein [Candidatus Cetobacterium colombiensis]MDX8337160.1 ROK family protein [Candidatus Cetobacterium colombiensis]